MSVQSVDAQSLKTWLDNGEAVLVDVRQPAEYESRHIAHAISLPLSNISAGRLPETAGRKLVIQCKSGMRSGMACKSLQSEMPDAVLYTLNGGLDAWKAAGFPVEGTGKMVLPLDRQVQLTIGLGVFAGSLLAYFVSPLFLLLTGFFGLGLTFAGLTGICGLARLMARAPWNSATA